MVKRHRIASFQSQIKETWLAHHLVIVDHHQDSICLEILILLQSDQEMMLLETCSKDQSIRALQELNTHHQLEGAQQWVKAFMVNKRDTLH